ncbi:MAG: glycosyltransferase, partial [Calditrichia bacterium]
MQWVPLGISLFIFLLNFYFLRWVLRGLKKVKEEPSSHNPERHSYSVIIAAHNEEKNLPHCLEVLIRQEYPLSLYEIVVVADRCTDDTGVVVRRFQKRFPQIRLIEIDSVPQGISPKKFALQKGIDAAKHPHLLFVDGDVLTTTRFIQTMNQHFNKDIVAVIGLMKLRTTRTLFQRFLVFERMLNWSVAAAGVGNKQPVIAYGGAWGYSRSAFREVNGFEGIQHCLGGDDDLVVQKFGRANLTVAFCTNPDGWVTTEAPQSFKQFLRQRKRHISAAKYYRLKFKLGYFFFHSSNLLLWLMPLIYPPAVFLLLLRLFSGAVLINKGNKLFKEQLPFIYILPMEILFLLYN